MNVLNCVLTQAALELKAKPRYVRLPVSSGPLGLPSLAVLWLQTV